MRIGLNLLYLLPGIVGGTESYAAGLLQGLATVASEDEFIVFVNRQAHDWPLPNRPNFTRVVCPVSGVKRASRYLFEQILFPYCIKHEQVDLIHSLGYVGPIISPCPSVLTIPDTNFIDLAATMPAYRRLPLRLISTAAARRADAVITISEFSRERIRQLLKLPRNTTEVTYMAPQPHIHTTSSNSKWPIIQQLYDINQPYIVAFGGGAVHKNIPILLQAFGRLIDKTDHQLVLVGHLPPNLHMDTLEQMPKLMGRIRVTGYVPSEHIGALLCHADLFVLPSLYEGFGIPVLEAQQAGTVVACSTAGSLPEVAGDGAAFFDPTSPDSMSETILNCLAQPEVRKALQRKGKENLRRFSWTKTARETLAVYHQILD